MGMVVNNWEVVMPVAAALVGAVPMSISGSVSQSVRCQWNDSRRQQYSVSEIINGGFDGNTSGIIVQSGGGTQYVR